jgi:TetR/AcrR family transcriptional repressor of nem operon
MSRHIEKDRNKIMGDTRQQLLQAAADGFASAGYSGANINTISITAGYAKGTIYNYFSSKHALLMALIDETAQLHFDFISERVLPVSEPGQRLEEFFKAGFDFVVRYLPRARVLFNAINGSDEQLKAHIFEIYQPMFKFVAAEIVALGIEEGVFKPTEPLSMSTLLMTIYLGTASNIDDQGHHWLDPGQVAELVLFGLSQNRS